MLGSIVKKLQHLQIGNVSKVTRNIEDGDPSNWSVPLVYTKLLAFIITCCNKLFLAQNTIIV